MKLPILVVLNITMNSLDSPGFSVSKYTNFLVFIFPNHGQSALKSANTKPSSYSYSSTIIFDKSKAPVFVTRNLNMV